MPLCDRCNDEYESYIVCVRDDISAIVSFLGEEYDNLCKPCRVAVHGDSGQAFAGAGKIEPKTEDEINTEENTA